MSFNEFLSKIDYRLSPMAFSRAGYQVTIIINKLRKLHHDKFNYLLDVGGGYDGRYRKYLEDLSNKYSNLEIKKDSNVDIVGSIYKIPIKDNSVDLVTSFMVLEHLSDPLKALKECKRVLRKKGYIALTTVQYWHTHSYPSDYFRYTKYGLEYLLKESKFYVIDIWSHGGPFLVTFHSIELNLSGIWRTIFSILFYRVFDYLDWMFYKHNDHRVNFDSVGWSVIAQKL